MIYRQATPRDAPAIAAFLRRHVQTSMFPLANLAAHGIGGDKPRATRFWVRDTAGALAAVYGETNEGMALPQIPQHGAEDWHALRALGCGSALLGALGAADQVRAMLAAWGQAGRPARHDADEPGFTLDLDALVVPDAPAESRIVPLGEIPRATALHWRTAYHVETLGTPRAEAPASAARDLDGYVAAGRHRALLIDGKAVAMTGFNAEVGDVVQIGGVYTPPELRGLGLARRALALHLAEARAAGITRAVLFAASAAACRVYTSVGFQPAGRFAMVLFDPSGAPA